MMFYISVLLTFIGVAFSHNNLHLPNYPFDLKDLPLGKCQNNVHCKADECCAKNANVGHFGTCKNVLYFGDVCYPNATTAACNCRTGLSCISVSGRYSCLYMTDE